jgi:NHL repeat-containing protein
MRRRVLSSGLCFLFVLSATAFGLEEFKVKREAVFEFAAKPVITRRGDRITIAFATKGFCDVTVAIESEEKKIIRHLASGVLGKNAPPPFAKNSKQQSIVWDGKDDRGVYVDDKEGLSVRVSLGLKPRFEKTLYWSPHKRISNNAPLMASAPEGVYVYEGQGLDHLRLFDHGGKYVRTVYPFPAGKIPEVKGLQTHKFPQDGKTLPLKLGFEQATLLTSGSSAWGGEGGHAGGVGATAMAVHPRPGGKTRIALAYHKLNRLASDGSSGGLPLLGPDVGFKVTGFRRRQMIVGPTDMAFSPDGRTLYMTGYVWKTGPFTGYANAFHAVMKMDYEKGDKPKIFAGVLKGDAGYGKGNDRFCVPTSVACDKRGRVYVADYLNSRVQVFSPAGRHLKTLRTKNPATVRVDPKSGEIWAFSWGMIGPSIKTMREYGFNPDKVKPSVTSLGTFEKPRRAKPEPLPSVSASGRGGQVASGGQFHQAAVDFHGGKPVLWLVGRHPTVSLAEANWMGGGGIWSFLGGWGKRGVRLFSKEGGKWTVQADFGKTAHKKVLRTTPAPFSRQRLLVHPPSGKLYVMEEQTGPGKSFYSVLRITPETGKIKEVKLPFDAEDMIFDSEGLAYLKTDREIVRFDTRSWREVPWDYGEIRKSVGFASSGALPKHNAVSALPLPGGRPVWWHSTGMWISPQRHLAVVCNIRVRKKERSPKDKYFRGGISRKYTPPMYPGRSGSRVILIFDKHGKMISEDAVPGMTNGDGVGIDKDDNLYVMVAAPRIIKGKRYFNEKSETLMKFKPGKARFVSAGRAQIKLPAALKPKRSADISKYGMGATWVKGAEWFYGGVGYGGQGGSCTCWHARFKLDYFARSFVPEVRRFQVAVLDSAGNLILRLGRYGNVDDGKPLDAKGGPAKPRSLGGDEVALAHAAYVGVHTDRRLFIHDAGNGRILSVKLGYHATEQVRLKNVPDAAKRR